MIVVEELAEYLETLRKVLINKVYRRVRDSSSVRPDRVGNMSYTDSVKMYTVLCVHRFLNETLRIEIVVVSCNEDVNVAHYFKHVKPLLERLSRKLDLR